MDDNRDSRTAKGWGEQEEELEAFGLSTLATAYGSTAGELKARTSSSASSGWKRRAAAAGTGGIAQVGPVGWCDWLVGVRARDKAAVELHANWPNGRAHLHCPERGCA